MKNKIPAWNVFLSLVVVALFFWAVVKLNPSTAGPLDASAVASENELVLLISDSCTACNSLEAPAKDLAEKAGLGFRTLRYSQPMPVPNYMVVFEGTATVGSVRNLQDLKDQLCVTAGIKSVCD